MELTKKCIMVKGDRELLEQISGLIEPDFPDSLRNEYYRQRALYNRVNPRVGFTPEGMANIVAASGIPIDGGEQTADPNDDPETITDLKSTSLDSPIGGAKYGGLTFRQAAETRANDLRKSIKSPRWSAEKKELARLALAQIDVATPVLHEAGA